MCGLGKAWKGLKTLFKTNIVLVGTDEIAGTFSGPQLLSTIKIFFNANTNTKVVSVCVYGRGGWEGRGLYMVYWGCRSGGSAWG